MARRALGVLACAVVTLTSGCGGPVHVTQAPSPPPPTPTHPMPPSPTPTRPLPPSPSPTRSLPVPATPLESPGAESTEPGTYENFPPYEEAPDDRFSPTAADLSGFLDRGMSQSDFMTVDGHLDSLFTVLNSEQPDPAKHVAFYRATKVTREKSDGGAWVYTARLITNVGHHDLRITVKDCSDCWDAVSIAVDGIKTL